MPTYCLTLEYDGTDFHGWQAQPQARTVAGVLLHALRTVTSEEPQITAAGRTDAGAHAHGQVAGVTLQRAWDPDRLRLALNATLPRDVVVLSVELRADSFHARHDAVDREYRYVVVSSAERVPTRDRFSWTVRGPLDIASMREAAAHLIGKHDFCAFGVAPNPHGTTVRTVYDVRVEALREQEDPSVDGVVINVRADAFLRGMMRAFAAALVRVGQGRATPRWVREVLETETQTPLVSVAPARGLHQWRVGYGSVVVVGRAA
jgi:tRNA pseudouridine38-40 synthase